VQGQKYSVKQTGGLYLATPFKWSFVGEGTTGTFSMQSSGIVPIPYVKKFLEPTFSGNPMLMSGVGTGSIIYDEFWIFKASLLNTSQSPFIKVNAGEFPIPPSIFAGVGANNVIAYLVFLKNDLTLGLSEEDVNPTDSTIIKLGVTVVTNSSITLLQTVPWTSTTTSRERIEGSKLLNMVVDGLIGRELAHHQYSVVQEGINYEINPSFVWKKDIPRAEPLKWKPWWSGANLLNVFIGPKFTEVETKYDLNGILTELSTDKWGIFRLVVSPATGLFALVYGKHQFDSRAEAKAASVQSSGFETFPFTNMLEVGRFIVKEGCVSFRDYSTFEWVSGAEGSTTGTQVTAHNSLNEIQGGIAGERFHLDQTEYINRDSRLRNNWQPFAGTSTSTYALNCMVNYSGKIYKNITGTNTTTSPAVDTTNWVAFEHLSPSQFDGLVAMLNDLEPVGTIVSSLLTESQFIAAKNNNGKWVMMKGQSIGGSDFSNITGITSLPNQDAENGMHLRGANSRTLGATENGQTNNIDKLSTTWDSSQLEGEVVVPDKGDWVGRRSLISYWAASNSTTWLKKKGIETRVPNIAVNYFIKINS